jgi:hypothetical protein
MTQRYSRRGFAASRDAQGHGELLVDGQEVGASRWMVAPVLVIRW